MDSVIEFFRAIGSELLVATFALLLTVIASWQSRRHNILAAVCIYAGYQTTAKRSFKNILTIQNLNAARSPEKCSRSRKPSKQ